MKKITKIILITFGLILVVCGCLFAYSKYQEYLLLERIKNAIINSNGFEYLLPIYILPLFFV